MNWTSILAKKRKKIDLQRIYLETGIYCFYQQANDQLAFQLSAKLDEVEKNINNSTVVNLYGEIESSFY